MCTVRIAIGHAMVRGVNTRYTEESQEEEEGCEDENPRKRANTLD